MTTDAFSFELSFNQHLRCNSCMVCSNLPQCAAASHSVVSNECVHDRLLKSVSHVKGAGDVRWWDRNAVRLFTGTRGEVIFCFPFFVPARFYISRRKCLIHSLGKPHALPVFDLLGQIVFGQWIASILVVPPGIT